MCAAAGTLPNARLRAAASSRASAGLCAAVGSLPNARSCIGCAAAGSLCKMELRLCCGVAGSLPNARLRAAAGSQAHAGLNVCSSGLAAPMRSYVLWRACCPERVECMLRQARCPERSKLCCGGLAAHCEVMCCGRLAAPSVC